MPNTRYTHVFVLCTGRTGSVTFVKACQYMTNYTAAHESRIQELGKQRLAYPDNHIEADYRLSWFLGRLDKKYRNEAFYVYMKRDSEAVASSYNKRWLGYGNIMPAYTKGIIQQEYTLDNIAYCRDYVETVNSNIELFLKDKAHKMVFHLENIETDFRAFWEAIGAQGDLEKALATWQVQHNMGKPKNRPWKETKAKLKRFLKKLPLFLKEV